MTAETLNGAHGANGANGSNGLSLPAGDLGGTDEPRGKKKRKQEKKEAKKHRALLERFPESPRNFDHAQTELEQAAAASPQTSGRYLKDWVRPAARNLNNGQLVLAQRSSALIAINCLMLSFAVLAVYREAPVGLVWWALVPLGLTNLLSLVFAIFSAQPSEATTLDQLCELPDAEFEVALKAILDDKDHLNKSLKRDVRVMGSDLNRRGRRLGTGYRVLLGGIPLSILTLGLCLALAARP